jgi:hypothetical protein
LPGTPPCHPREQGKPDRSRAAKQPDCRCTKRRRSLFLLTTTEHHLILFLASTSSPAKRPPALGCCPETPRLLRTGRTLHHEATRCPKKPPQENQLPTTPKAWPTPSPKQQQAPLTKEAAIPASSSDRSAEDPPDLAEKTAGKFTSCTCQRLRRPHGQNHHAPLATQLQGARTPPPSSGSAAPAFRLCCVGDAARGPRDPSGHEAHRHCGTGRGSDSRGGGQRRTGESPPVRPERARQGSGIAAHFFVFICCSLSTFGHLHTISVSTTVATVPAVIQLARVIFC